MRVKAFRDEAYEKELDLDDGGRVTHCFLAHITMVELMRLNHNVLVLDSAYRTNKYRLPLLLAVVSTALHTTFFASVVFMKNENEDSSRTAVGILYKLMHTNALQKGFAVDRELALISALRYQFPEDSTLLCVWHIEKNITKNCKGSLGSSHEQFMKDWAAVRSFYFANFTKLVIHLADIHYFCR